MRTAAILASLALVPALAAAEWLPGTGHYERVHADAKARVIDAHWSKVKALEAAKDSPNTAFFISPAGGESGDGSRNNPWGNLNKISQVSQFNAGSTVYVEPGTYRGMENCNVVISNSINVISLRGATANDVVVEMSSCKGVGWQVQDTNGHIAVIIHGITFTGGSSSSQSTGAALTLRERNPLPMSVTSIGISNCVFDSFTHGGSGGAVVVTSNLANTVFTNCSFDQFTGSSVLNNGALTYEPQSTHSPLGHRSNHYIHQTKFQRVVSAAALKTTSEAGSSGFLLYVLESSFRQNSAQAIAAVDMANPDALVLVNTTLLGNGGAAGAIEAVNSNLTIAMSSVSDTVGTGIMYGRNSLSMVYQCQFNMNHASHSSSAAGGLDIQGNSSVTVMKSLFAGCTGGVAGGIWVHGGNAPAPVYLVSSTVENCKASNAAGSGGIFVGEPSSKALKSSGTATQSYFKCCEAAGHHDALGGTGLIQSGCTVDNTGC